MSTPSLRDEIAQYIANEYTDRRICEADRMQADDILAILTRHTAINALKTFRDGSRRHTEALEAYDTARRAIGDKS